LSVESKHVAVISIINNKFFLCWLIIIYYNRLKATGHVMHNQFNIQQLYALPTLY